MLFFVHLLFNKNVLDFKKFNSPLLYKFCTVLPKNIKQYVQAGI